MRTTLTLDDDVAQALRDLEHTTRRRFKDLVNDLIRKGLAVGAKPPAPQKPFKVIPRAGGFKPGIDPFKLNQLVDQLEVEDFISKHRKRSSS